MFSPACNYKKLFFLFGKVVPNHSLAPFSSVNLSPPARVGHNWYIASKATEASREAASKAKEAKAGGGKVDRLVGIYQGGGGCLVGTGVIIK